MGGGNTRAGLLLERGALRTIRARMLLFTVTGAMRGCHSGTGWWGGGIQVGSLLLLLLLLLVPKGLTAAARQ